MLVKMAGSARKRTSVPRLSVGPVAVRGATRCPWRNSI
ncbi:Uncharacterised protein [Bordetella pertussis]|nr:Uncharacterised protein [Bordetella pertussis]CFP65437.1 Uncharacterised protein [Bordetella pertussis]CFW38072.1 Uncharacterised protein [Bordetella pertussis]